MAARVVHKVGSQYDKKNYLLMFAMGPNVAGVIGSAVAAGVLLGEVGMDPATGHAAGDPAAGSGGA